MRLLVHGIILIFCALASCEYRSEANGRVSDSLRHEAIKELHAIAASDLQWPKVHAADHLIDLEYRPYVDSIFRLEAVRAGDAPYYRVGIWRVLSRTGANADLRGQWIKKIQDTYTDSLAPDRTHAVEALAKLRIPPRTDATNNETAVISIFRLWADAYLSESSKGNSVTALLQILHAEDRTERERKLAAYALRHIDSFDPVEWSRLIDAESKTVLHSDFQTYLRSLCWWTAPRDSMSTPRMRGVSERLLQASSSTSTAHKRELALTLAESGNISHLPVLVGMLDSNAGIDASESADVRAAAAYAILRIDRRLEPTLAIFDWVVIVAYGILMLVIGWYYSKRNKTKEDYLLGGRKMNSVAVGISLFATLLSTLSYLSYPGEMIKYGPVIFAGMLALPLVYFAAGWWLIPRIMQMQVTSAYEILELKLGLSVRMLATSMFLSLRFLWMATLIYVTVDVALMAVVPIDAFYVPFVSMLLLVITIVYTSMGGLKAVVVTDVIQSIIFMAGAFLSIAVVCVHFGSLTSWLPSEWPLYWKPLKIGFDAQERATVGNAVLMIFTWYMCTTGSDQMAIQRYLSTKDIKAARKSLKVSLYANLLAKCLLGLLGLAMFAFFSDNTHLLEDGQSLTSQADKLFPRFILLGLPVGLSGLVIAGLLAAAMSSLSSGLNSVSSVVSEDLIKRFSRKERVISHNESVTQVKVLSYVTGFIVIILSMFVGSVQGNLFDIVVKVVNLFVAPLFVLFFMALFVRFATEKGTFLGGIMAIVVAVAIAFFGVYGISVLWIMPFSFLAGSISGCLFSLIDNALKKEL